MGKQRDKAGYVSYLLRLWQTFNGENWVWRASLELPGVDERKGFNSLQELFAYLIHETDLESSEDYNETSAGAPLPGARPS